MFYIFNHHLTGVWKHTFAKSKSIVALFGILKLFDDLKFFTRHKI